LVVEEIAARREIIQDKIYRNPMLDACSVKGYSGWFLSAVGVCSRLEFLDAAGRSNVFNAVTKRSFVL
jgi:hypothetical protein